MEGGLYELKTATDLLKKAKMEFQELHNSPNEFVLFNLLCTLNHLRDWILPAGHKSYKEKEETGCMLTKEEEFHKSLHTNKNYVIVNSLCNASKHFKKKERTPETHIKCGFFAGKNEAGHSLNYRHYYVEIEKEGNKKFKDLQEVVEELLTDYSNFLDN